jgi:hypothetical protein
MAHRFEHPRNNRIGRWLGSLIPNSGYSAHAGKGNSELIRPALAHQNEQEWRSSCEIRDKLELERQ